MRQRWWWHAPAWLLGLCVGLGYFLSSPRTGDFWWFDASRHAMNSVFVHDFFAQGGWKDPIRSAKAYYDQYPGINIGFYPPFLYLVTAPWLAVFGVSHAVCQAVVSAFAALTAMAGYAWTRPVLGRWAACAAGAMLVLAPEMALWGRQVQLDVPAVALLLWGSWALVVWLEGARRVGVGRVGVERAGGGREAGGPEAGGLDSGRPVGLGPQGPGSRWLLLAAVLLGCAMLTRVQTVFAWPLWLAVVFVHPVGRAQPWRPRLWATALYGLLSLPSVASAVYFAKVMGSLAGQMPDMPPLASWANWAWYASRFGEQLGAMGLSVLLLGLLLMVMALVRSLRRFRRPTAVLLLMHGRAGWALALGLAAWLFFTVVSNKEPRFGLPILPFVMLAALLVIGRWPQLWRMGAAPTPASAASVVSVLVLFAGMLIEAHVSHRWTDVPRVTGHREAALVAARLAPSNARVLISAHRDGNFIFSLRAEGQRPDLAVRRADKWLVDITIMRQLGIRDRGLTEDDIRALLDREHVAVVVAQTGYLGDQPSMQALERLLASGCCFVLRQTVPILGQHRPDETELRVYSRR